MKISALMLAGGQSKRFTGIKQLADINGQPMLLRTLNQLTGSGSLCTLLSEFNVILGANAERISPVLPHYVTAHLCSDWHKGMGATLAFGVHNVNRESSHLLVTLADQVALGREHMETMLHHCESAPNKIISASYNGILGAPVIFPRCYFAQLMTLQADSGARKIIQQHIQEVVSVDLPDAKYDIDTQRDLANWRQSAD
ncbi:nucleotidyltransferase family protein [Paraglaciecola polaris]|uniref:Molybdenum cofactor cytidylyltransferase n=1 Tax=Paraglaciecola polaris LMG 21857 TaxID=1129793 RepID=K6ZCN3_9ALTE|nr:nucleotidyltransferase family protein [Paraglaciecola polaris]GAC33821.1 molybdenum cofactor cytidylyltransferase [Paraglaciecola polaris LMG 21857]|tara:strand:+ start:722 stop:1318 length:597 start_codon:yes stop_codon:yes gene_type:complete